MSDETKCPACGGLGVRVAGISLMEPCPHCSETEWWSRAAAPGRDARRYGFHFAAGAPVTPDREAWREAVRSGDLDRPHPVDCRDRCCAVEEAGE